MKITYKFIDGERDVSFDLDRNCVLFGPNGSGKTRILKTLVEISDFRLRVNSIPEILSKYNIENLKIDDYNLNSASEGAIINIKDSNERLINEFIKVNKVAFKDIKDMFRQITHYNRDTPYLPIRPFRTQILRINRILDDTERFEGVDKDIEIRLFIQSTKRLLIDVEKRLNIFNSDDDFANLEKIFQTTYSIINFIERRYEDYKFANDFPKEKHKELRVAGQELHQLGIKNNAKYISTELSEVNEIIKNVENTFNKIKMDIGNEYLSIVCQDAFEFEDDINFKSKNLISLQKKLVKNKVKIDDLNDELFQFCKLKLVINNNQFTIHKNGNELPIETLSSGEKRLLTLFLNVSFSNENLLLIDEPEVSLSLSVQSKIIFSLKNMAKKYDKKLIIATHAPYVYESCEKSDFELVRLF
jgi:ABC-type lipoprotein export system ATPase subunit